MIVTRKSESLASSSHIFKCLTRSLLLGGGGAARIRASRDEDIIFEESYARKWLVATTFLPLLDYMDVLYMNASAQSLYLLDAAYHGVLRFRTSCKSLTHHCSLYSLVNCSSLSMSRTLRWYNFIYKSILGLLPTYLSTYMSHKQCCHSLRCQDFITLSIHSVHTELGRSRAWPIYRLADNIGQHLGSDWVIPVCNPPIKGR